MISNSCINTQYNSCPVGWDKIPISSWEASLTDIKAFNNFPTCALLPSITVLNAMGPTGLKKAQIPNPSLSCPSVLLISLLDIGALPTFLLTLLD